MASYNTGNLEYALRRSYKLEIKALRSRNAARDVLAFDDLPGPASRNWTFTQRRFRQAIKSNLLLNAHNTIAVWGNALLYIKHEFSSFKYENSCFV